jgi:hypothetical protein
MNKISRNLILVFALSSASTGIAYAQFPGDHGDHRDPGRGPGGGAPIPVLGALTGLALAGGIRYFVKRGK